MMKLRGLHQGLTTLKLVETMLCLTSEPLRLEYKERKHFGGSNHADFMRPVAVMPLEDTWRVSDKDKKAILGKSGKVLSGGGRGGSQSRPEVSEETDLRRQQGANELAQRVCVLVRGPT